MLPAGQFLAKEGPTAFAHDGWGVDAGLGVRCIVLRPAALRRNLEVGFVWLGNQQSRDAGQGHPRQ